MSNTQIDFQVEKQKLRVSDAKFQSKIQQVIQRDNEYQQALAARGGTMLTSVTEKADHAARRVMRDRDEARAALARPVVKQATVDRAALIAKAQASARQFLEDYGTLANFEHALGDYLAAAGQPQPVMATGGDLHPVAFVQRAERALTTPATPARAVALPAIAEPDYAGIVTIVNTAG